MFFRPPQRPHGSDVGIESGSADAEPLAYVRNSDFRIGKQCFGFADFLLIHGGSSTALAAARPGGFETGNGALDEQASFVLGKDGGDLEEHISGRGAGVDLLGEAFKADVSISQVIDDPDQFGDGSTEAVQPPDNKGVTRPEHVAQHLVQFRGAFASTAGAGTADLFGIDLAAAGALKRVPLQREVLVILGLAAIADAKSIGGF